MKSLSEAEPGSIILLHSCAHNPTGCDPSKEQWEKLADIVIEKKLYPFFDSAYQGFASGDLENDAFAIRMFAKKKICFLLAQSFAKNMGLYGERIGALHAVCSSESVAKLAFEQLKQVIRPQYSNPPVHGAHIVATVLGDN